MRHKPFILIPLYIFFLLAGSVYGIGEKTISLGSASSWGLMEKRRGISEASLIRPQPVLVLNNSLRDQNPDGVVSPDLHLSFDEARPIYFRDSLGRYEVSVSPELGLVTEPYSRIGRGAALFNGKTGRGVSGGPLELRPGKDALFAPGSYIRDFSLEFWLYPQNLETGESVLSFTASRPDGNGVFINQEIQCIASKNRLFWKFGNFFFAPGEKERKSISISGPPVLNRVWSHHLIRFDADLGLLEYLVDGRLEAVDYATSTGREGGEVYTPVVGENCRLDLGPRFSGMIDEFRIYKGSLNKVMLAKYPAHGGRVETRTLDLGSEYSRLLKIEAFGGRTGILPPPAAAYKAAASHTADAAGAFRNEYSGNAPLKYPDHSEIRFYARISNSPYLWNDVPWILVEPGKELTEGFRGRYMQIAADFYPAANGEVSPYLSELRIIYNAAEAPPPPTQLMAVAKNGAVELSWKESPSRNVGGYMIYYGNEKGEYFGSSAVLDSAVRPSPIDVGSRTTVTIEGLSNGVLYYFTVAAYNKPDLPDALPEPGEFSREAAARPLAALVMPVVQRLR